MGWRNLAPTSGASNRSVRLAQLNKSISFVSPFLPVCFANIPTLDCLTIKPRAYLRYTPKDGFHKANVTFIFTATIDAGSPSDKITLHCWNAVI